MNKLLIMGFAVLMGISTAGIVWYFWGFAENFSVVLHNKKVPQDESAGDDAETTDDAEA